MATFVSAADNSNYTGVTSTALIVGPLTLTVGHLAVVLVRGSNCTGVTDTFGNPYTLRATDAAGVLRIFSSVLAAGGPSQYVTGAFSPATAYLSVVHLQFSGAATSGEFLSAFTTAAVTSGTTIDNAYDTGGQSNALVVGLADVFANGPYSFAAFGTSGDPASYVEPVADHASASFFYRLPAAALTADTVRATCATSGVEKHLLVAVFKSAVTAVATADAYVWGPL